MLRFVLKRLIYAIPTLIGITLLTFTFLRFVPGDPAVLMAGEDGRNDPILVENIREELGLNEPLPVQYFTYVFGLVRGDLGTSYVTRQPVADQIARRYPRTFSLATSGLLFSLILGVGFGTIAGLWPGSKLDAGTLVLALGLQAIPGFWLGLMLIYLFSVQLQWLPMLGLTSPLHLVLPMLAMGIGGWAYFSRMTRANLVEVMSEEYIRTARAKGLRERMIVVRHALKNALMPVLTIAGLQYGFMLGSSILIETVFSIDGIGRMMADGIFARDIPLVQSGVMVLALNFVVVMILIDIMQAALDPRIRTTA